MNFARVISLAVLLAAAVSVSMADTVTSTSSGGLWSDPLTWEGGQVPGIYDDVTVIGPVEVAGLNACLSLHVEPSGSVIADQVAPPRQLAIYGQVVNDGTIADDEYFWLDLEIHGDILNTGIWSAHQVILGGSDNREISNPSGAGFESNFTTDPDASGDITITTPATFHGFIDFTGYRVILAPGSHLTLPSSSLSGEIMAQGNEIRFQSWSYLERCTIDDAVLVGDAEATYSVLFTTRLTVMGQLQNGSGGGGAVVEGDLINYGTIRNDQYSFFFSVHGDVENYGTIDTPQLSLEGVGVTHHFAMGLGANTHSTVFLPEFQVSTLIATTPVTFGGGLGLGMGTLILEPGASAHFPNHGGVSSFEGYIEANGNTITTEGTNSAISEITVDNAVLGDATVLSDILFTDGLTVAGAVRGFTWGEADLTVEGRLRVEGSIADGGHPVRITALGDLENLGSMTNLRVTMAGTVDQFVGAGPGMDVPQFVMESGLSAANYQWYRDDVMLVGETDPSLMLNTLDANDYGRYHCEGDGFVSRSVFITEVLDITDVPGFLSATLEQNHPNPFNPATNIAFTLERTEWVSLVVYDLAGREVDRLVDEVRGAGLNLVTWQPKGLGSGTYVYRLRAEDVDVTRKCILLK